MAGGRTLPTYHIYGTRTTTTKNDNHNTRTTTTKNDRTIERLNGGRPDSTYLPNLWYTDDDDDDNF